MQWNLDNIQFLFQPDVFAGTFDNPKMQKRHEAMQKEKISSLKDQLSRISDPLAAMLVLEKGDHFQFLRNNKQQFDEHGLFERAVLKLFYRKNTPFFMDGDFSQWLELFKQCNRDRMLQEGTPMSGGEITGYRGSVTGITRGFSWSLDKEHVRRILDSWNDANRGGGTVFSRKFAPEEILYHEQNDKRHEIIVIPELVEQPDAMVITSI